MGEIAINPIHNVHKKYRTMNLVNSYVFTPPVDLSTNTEIGGVASTISTPALLATKLAIDVSRISNFAIVGSDIKCRITGSYALPNYSFTTGGATYYIDSDNLVIQINEGSFFSGTENILIKEINFNGVLLVGNGSFQKGSFSTAIETVILSNCTTFSQFNVFRVNNVVKKVYIPRVTVLGTSTGDDLHFNGASSLKLIYVNPALATSNAGGEDGDIAYLRTQGCVIRYVTNFTAPNAVTTLAAGTIHNTAFQLNFTAPSATNAIDYYEVYLNGIYKKKINASGDYVDGLVPNTAHNVSVYAVDIFMNKSVISNIVNVTTAVFGVPTYRLKSFYALNETSGSTVNDSYGTEHLTNTGITVNQTGKLGTSYLSTGASQKLEKTDSAPITGNFSLNVWSYQTANATQYSALIEYGSYVGNNGFGLWFDTAGTNNLLFRINQTIPILAGKSLALNQWNMSTMVYNGVDVKIYVNGVLKSTQLHTVNPTPSTNKKIFQGHSGAMFLGKIDLPAVYDRAITIEDITTLYNSGSGVSL